MLQKIEIHGIHMKIDENLMKYTTRKLGHVDKYLSRHSRGSARAEVQLKEDKTVAHNHCTCEVAMHLPQETIVIKESTLNIYAAVDIVEAKLKQQLRKYKDLHQSGKMHRRLIARLGRNPA